MWHDVPNRGGRITIVAAERNIGDIGLTSGWQGDNSGAHRARASARTNMSSCRWRTSHDGSTDHRHGAGPHLQCQRRQLAADADLDQPVPYKPATLDTTQGDADHPRLARPLTARSARRTTIAPADWAWAKCDAAHPFPGTPDPTQICLRQRFRSRTCSTRWSSPPRIPTCWASASPPSATSAPSSATPRTTIRHAQSDGGPSANG